MLQKDDKNILFSWIEVWSAVGKLAVILLSSSWDGAERTINRKERHLGRGSLLSFGTPEGTILEIRSLEGLCVCSADGSPSF